MRTFFTLLITTFTISRVAQAQVTADSVSKDLQSLKKDLGALTNLKISGWVQTQFQYVQTRGAANYDGGNFAPNSDKRFMIRRGRIKFTYLGKNSVNVLQINGTERGLNLVEFYTSLTDPWTKMFSVTAGVMNRPFGFEIDQSSSVRESPERSRYTQILMPNERDLGAKIVFAPGKDSKWHGLRLDAGFYNGQGIYVPPPSTPAGYPAGTIPVLGVNEFDFNKDFIGRLSYYKSIHDQKITFGFGASHYNGGNLYQTNTVYSDVVTNAEGSKQWKARDTSSTSFRNKVAPRIYYGGELFFSVRTKVGTTTLRGEYITGTQSGSAVSSASPIFIAPSGATYIRQFEGMYAYFIHRIAESKHEVLVKYEWYDPNTHVKGSDIKGGSPDVFTAADIKYTQLGLGYNYYMQANVKFMVYYNIITNESTSLSEFSKDLRDNVLTLRMQYRF